MSDVISTTVTQLQSGGTCTVIEWATGKAYVYSLPDAVVPTATAAVRYQPGDAGYRRAMRVIDAKFDSGEITAREAQQMEEDYVTESDRAERD